MRRASFLWWGMVLLLLAALLRFAALQEVPPGLAQDEVLDADIASFILAGRHAIFFREGYGHEPLYHYFAAPFQFLLGDNVLSVRLPAGYLGLLLVAATLRWTGQTFGRRAALLAGAFLAVSWWPIVFSRIGLRPILEPVLLVAAALFWPLPPAGAEHKERSWPHGGRTALAGLFLGLSLYAYTAAQVMLLLPLLYAAYLWIGRLARPAAIARMLVILLGVAVLVVLPLALTLRADPTLLQRVDQLSGPLDELRAGNVRPVLETTLATLGVFAFTGDPRPTYMLPGRPLFDPLTALFFFGGLLLAASRARRQPAYGFVLLWLAAGLIPSAITPQAPSTVRLVGAMPVVYLLPALAGNWVAGGRGQVTGGKWQVALGVLVVVVVGLNLGRTVAQGFVQWPAELETRLRYQTVFRDIARALEASDDPAPVIAEAYYEPIDHDSVRRNLGRPLEARWVQLGQALVFPAGGGGQLYVPETAIPGQMAGLLDPPLYRSPGRPSFAVYALPDVPEMGMLPEPVTFGGALTLLGYARQPPWVDDTWPLLTYWQVEASLPADVAVFVHLLDASGEIAAQYDGLDAAAGRLRPGDRFLQLHPLPPRTVPGPYTLQIGVYTRGDDQRLLRPGDPPDRLLLEQNVGEWAQTGMDE